MKPGTFTRIFLTLRPSPGDARPVEVRLRQLLKFAARSCGMACTRLEARGNAKDVRLPTVAPEAPVPTVALIDELERETARVMRGEDPEP